MTKLSSGSYRATVTLKTGGSAGTLKISVQAKDAKGNLNKTYLKLPALVGNRRTGVSRRSRGTAPDRTRPHRTTPRPGPSGQWFRLCTVPRVDRMSQLVRAPVRSIALITLALVVQALAGLLRHSPPRRLFPRVPDGAELRPTIHYEEARAHADDRIDFAPGGRVSVGFTPRAGDHWKVGGVSPRALPAGRLDGRQLREQDTPGAARAKVHGDPCDARAIADPRALGCPVRGPGARRVRSALPRAVGPARGRRPTADRPGRGRTRGRVRGLRLPEDAQSAPSAAVSSSGLQREVFGFLPYWELSDSSTTLDFAKISTIAYFGVGIDAAGNLQKLNSDGTTTVGWSGWTSSRMTSLINTAHEKRTRVVLTVQSFGWTRASSTARSASSAARPPAPTSPDRSPPPCATGEPTGSTSTSSRSSRGTRTSSSRSSGASGPSWTTCARATS